jgi:hypothetical protein
VLAKEISNGPHRVSTHELPIALGAIRSISRRLTLRQERCLDVIARLHGSSLRGRRVSAAPLQLTAATIRDPHRGKRLVQLGIIFTIVEGHVSHEQARALTTLARELEVDQPSIRTLPKLVKRQALRARSDGMGRMLRRFSPTAVHV